MANSSVGGVQEYIENAFPTARGRHTQTSGGGQTSGLPGPSTGKNKCSLIKANSCVDLPKSYMTTWASPTVVRFKDRDTGGSKGAMAPSKIFSSCCSKSLLFYYFSVSEYQIGTPRSHAYLVNFYLPLV